MDFQEELNNKKLKLKSDYLRAELEETQWIFQNSLVEFQKDFGENCNIEHKLCYNAYKSRYRFYERV